MSLLRGARVLPFLELAGQHMADDLAEKFGADVAAQIAEAFVKAVIECRREIEAGNSAALN
jgi:hypothetical protein